MKKDIFSLLVVSTLFVLPGCASFQTISEIQTGRSALRYGDPKVALVHFRRAAELDPDYVLRSAAVEQGVWTYVGRAHYATGNLPEARKALERARSRHQRDHLARMYLGLVLARDGERQKGLTEIDAGLRGLGNSLDYIDQNLEDGRFWDPAKTLRSEIQRDIAMISGKDINWQTLIASGEWLGREFEEEIERAKADKRRDRVGAPAGDEK